MAIVQAGGGTLARCEGAHGRDLDAVYGSCSAVKRQRCRACSELHFGTPEFLVRFTNLFLLCGGKMSKHAKPQFELDMRKLGS